MFNVNNVDRNIESFIEDNHYLDFIIEALRELNHA